MAVCMQEQPTTEKTNRTDKKKLPYTQYSTPQEHHMQAVLTGSTSSLHPHKLAHSHHCRLLSYNTSPHVPPVLLLVCACILLLFHLILFSSSFSSNLVETDTPRFFFFFPLFYLSLTRSCNCLRAPYIFMPRRRLVHFWIKCHPIHSPQAHQSYTCPKKPKKKTPKRETGKRKE